MSALELHVATPLALSQDAALAAAECAWQARIVDAVRAFAPPQAETLLAGFGGGGPLLLTAVATALGLTRAMIPGMAPVFSAFGIGFSILRKPISDTSPRVMPRRWRLRAANSWRAHVATCSPRARRWKAVR